MSRSIVTYPQRKDATADRALKQGEAAQPPEDRYKDRLLKYIPGEVVTLYLTLVALERTASGLPGWLDWVIFVVGLFGTWYYLRAYLNVTNRTQLVVSTISFGVWVFALGGPFNQLQWYKPVYGGLLLPTYTFFVAKIKPAPQAALV